MTLVKKSMSLGGHRTSVALEQPFWDEIERLAESRELPLVAFISEVDKARGNRSSLASALRVLALQAARSR